MIRNRNLHRFLLPHLDTLGVNASDFEPHDQSSSEQHSLQNVDAEHPGPGDDAALARLVSSQDEIRRRQQLGLSQERLGFFVAAGVGADRFTDRLWSALNLYHTHETANSFKMIHEPVVLYLLWLFPTITKQRLKRRWNQLELCASNSVLYLFAFSRTERVRKLIQIPSLLPKIHSMIPAQEQTVRGSPALSTCTPTVLVHRCILRPG